MDHRTRFFLGGWLAFSIASGAILFLKKDPAFRRRFHPWFSLLSGVLFLGVMVSMGWPLRDLVVMIPAVALIWLLSVRSTRFCPSCGSIVGGRPFSRPNYCQDCGSRLE